MYIKLSTLKETSGTSSRMCTSSIVNKHKSNSYPKPLISPDNLSEQLFVAYGNVKAYYHVDTLKTDVEFFHIESSKRRNKLHYVLKMLYNNIRVCLIDL